MANIVGAGAGAVSHSLTATAQKTFNNVIKLLTKSNQYFAQKVGAGAIAGGIPGGSAAVDAIPYAGTDNILFRIVTLSVGFAALVFGTVFTLSLVAGSNIAKRTMKAISSFFRALQVLNPPKYLTERDTKYKTIKIIYRIAHWPLYVFNIFIRAVSLLFSMSDLTFIFLMVILVGTFLQLEVYQNEMLDYIDYVIIIARDALNVIDALINVVGQTVMLFAVPIINPMIKFLVNCFLITKDYVVPLYLKAVQEDNALNGRRLTAANIPFFSKEYFLILEATGNVFSSLISLLLTFYEGMWGVINWLFFRAFGDQFDDVLKFMLNTIQGFYCYLEPDYVYCTLAQAVQSVIFFIALIINGILALIFSLIPFNVSPPKISDNFFNVQCERAYTVSGRTVSPEACLKCRPAFPGWINECPDESTRRSLRIECNDFTHINGTWNEKVYWEGALTHTPSYYNHTSNWRGCPLAKEGLLYNPLATHFKNTGHFGDCYDIVLDGELIIRCPLHPGVMHDPNLSEHDRRRLSRERNLLSFADDLKQRQKAEKVSNYQLINRDNFIKGYTDLIDGFSWDGSSSQVSIFNCSDHVPNGNQSNWHIFDTLCGFQSLVNRKEVASEVEGMYNPTKIKHSSNVYAKYRHKFGSDDTTTRVDRKLEEEKHYHTLVWIEDSIKKLKQITKRRQLRQRVEVPQIVNITAADGTCPLGYKKCPASPFCEKVNACLCPQQTEPFLTAHDERNYNYYQTMCQIKVFSPSAWMVDTINCWDQYRKKDTNTPFTAFENGANSFVRQIQTPPQDIIYCAPLIDPSNWLIPEIQSNFSLRAWFVTQYCDETKTNAVISECMCPGYMVGVDAEGGWWLNGLGYYLEARMWNWQEAWGDTFFAWLNFLMLGILNYMWQGLWRPLGAREPWTIVMSHQFETKNLGCAIFHSGSWGFGNIMFYVWAKFYFGCCFLPVWYFALDLPYIFILVPLGLDTKLNALNKKHADQVITAEVFSPEKTEQEKSEKLV